MSRKLNSRLILGGAALAMLLVCGSGCIPSIRQVYRQPSASTQYRAKTNYSRTLYIALPSDKRAEHYGEWVDNSRWKARSKDALGSTDAAQLIRERLVAELSASHMFSQVTTQAARPGDLVLNTDILVFCHDYVGFGIYKGGGISALQVSLEQDGKQLMDRKFEKAVSDSDAESTAPKHAFFHTEILRILMSDSLRELMRDLLKEIEATLAQVPPGVTNASTNP